MRDLISYLPAIVLIIIGAPSVHLMYVDMYGKIFQADLLQDCTVYFYDRVVDMHGPPRWCLNSKTNIDSGSDGNLYPSVYGFYIDAQNILNLLIYSSDGTHDHQKLISLDYIEALPGNYENVNTTLHINHRNATHGFYVLQETDLHSEFKITDSVCDKSSENFINYVNYNRTGNYVNATVHVEPCNPNLYQSSIKGTKTTVLLDPKNWSRKNCTVGDLDFFMISVPQSVQTVVYGYDMFKNLSESFPELYATETPSSNASFHGVIKENETLFAPGLKPLERPPIESNYTEVPFFFVNNNGSSYFPLFLYYKYVGYDLDFTVSFYNNSQIVQIINLTDYARKCGYREDGFTVAAAPRVIEQNETLIIFQVHFYRNKVDIKNCVIQISYYYATKEHELVLKPNSNITAYVHVETRSKTAVNCQFENRTVHWLLAYTEEKEGELISLDSDVSSPIFPCPLCGPDTVMYCDVNPQTAKKYDSAVFLITGNEIRFIGVKKSMTYMKRIEYYSTTLPDELYFAQQMNLSLSLDSIYNKPQTTKSHLQLQTTESPDEVDPVAGSSNAGGYLWINSFPFVILTCTFLTEVI